LGIANTVETRFGVASVGKGLTALADAAARLSNHYLWVIGSETDEWRTVTPPPS
jgi:hypothetical protein